MSAAIVVLGLLLAATTSVLVLGLYRCITHLSSREATSGPPDAATATDGRSAPTTCGTGRHEASPVGRRAMSSSGDVVVGRHP